MLDVMLSRDSSPCTLVVVPMEKAMVSAVRGLYVPTVYVQVTSWAMACAPLVFVLVTTWMGLCMVAVVTCRVLLSLLRTVLVAVLTRLTAVDRAMTWMLLV